MMPLPAPCELWEYRTKKSQGPFLYYTPEQMIEYGKKCKAESEQLKSTQWVAQEIDEFEIRVVSPEGEAWRLHSAYETDVFNNFIWRWAQSLIETKEVKQ